MLPNYLSNKLIRKI